MNSEKLLVVVVGPTAVGKTNFSLSLGDELGAEIVSADSRLLYKGMDIGTAKPTQHEMCRVKHYMIDVTTPDKSWSLAQYKRSACHYIDDIHNRGKIAMLVGGTGQYVRSIIEGWNIPPLPKDNSLRHELEAMLDEYGGVYLHDKLRGLDEESAKSIDFRNTRRVIRALEVCISTGRKFSEMRSKTKPNYRILIVGLMMARVELYKIIDDRIERMLKNGWVNEVQNLLDRGYSWIMPSMTALGYPEIGHYISGEISLSETRLRIGRNSRRLVRRQSSWFSISNPDIMWLDINSTDERTLLSQVYTGIERLR